MMMGDNSGARCYSGHQRHSSYLCWWRNFDCWQDKISPKCNNGENNSERPVDALAENGKWPTYWLSTSNQEMLAHLKRRIKVSTALVEIVIWSRKYRNGIKTGLNTQTQYIWKKTTITATPHIWLTQLFSIQQLFVWYWHQCFYSVLFSLADLRAHCTISCLSYKFQQRRSISTFFPSAIS